MNIFQTLVLIYLLGVSFVLARVIRTVSNHVKYLDAMLEAQHGALVQCNKLVKAIRLNAISIGFLNKAIYDKAIYADAPQGADMEFEAIKDLETDYSDGLTMEE